MIIMTYSIKIDPETGLLHSIPYKASPHCDARPQLIVIDMIVIHNISLPPNQFGGQAIEAFFCGELDFSQHPFFVSISHLKVSAHLLIKRKGEIIQFVPFNKRAWHAGESCFAGRSRCNDFSIGIELEGTDELPYEQVQYSQLSQIIRSLMRIYPEICLERIV